MPSDFCREERRDRGDSVFGTIPVGRDEPALFGQFLDGHDFAADTRKAFSQDVRKFASWFCIRKPGAVHGRPGHRAGCHRFQGSSASGVRAGGEHRQSGAGDVARVLPMVGRPWPRSSQPREASERVEAATVGTQGIGTFPGAPPASGG